MAMSRRSLSYSHDDNRETTKLPRRASSVAGPSPVSSGVSFIPINSDNFSSRHLSLRAQKKLVSGLANRRAIVKIFLEERACRILDNVYKLVYLYSGSTKEANKIMRNIVKINMKLGLLFLNDILSDKEKDDVWKFRERIHDLASLIVLYAGRPAWDIDLYSLILLFRECESLVCGVVQAHLSPRSFERLRLSVNFFANRPFLEGLYSGDKCFTDVMGFIVEDVRFLTDKGIL